MDFDLDDPYAEEHMIGYEGISDLFAESDNNEFMSDKSDMEIDKEEQELRIKEILEGGKGKKRRRSKSGSGRDSDRRTSDSSFENRSSADSWYTDMIECAREHKNETEKAKFLWNSVRGKLIKMDPTFLEKNIQEKRKLILMVIFETCENLKKVIIKNYNVIMNEFDKNKHAWIKNMKSPAESGGKGYMLGRTKKLGPPEESIINITRDCIQHFSKNELKEIAKNLENRFKIQYNKQGDSVGIKIIKNSDDMEKLNILFKKVKINKNESPDILIEKLKKLEIEESNKIVPEITTEQIRGLINLISSTEDYGKKYKIIKKLKEKSRKRSKTFKKVERPKDRKIKKYTETLFPLGDWDPDFDPDDVIGIETVEWIPHLTPMRKKRYEKTKMVYKIIRKGTRVYVLPEKITIDNKTFLYIRRFFDFNDYLKSLQNNLIRQYYDKNYSKLNKKCIVDKIKKINSYFKYLIKKLGNSSCDTELKIKLKSFISDDYIKTFFKNKI